MDWSWLTKYFDSVVAWFLGLVKAAFGAVWDMVTDLFVALIEMFFNALLTLLNLITVPDFMSGGIDALTSSMPGWMLFFMSATGFGPALALIGAGVGFRLLRKLATLGQW
ncbi:hypothetical protein HNQ50_001439 [Silvimonas terrae]|uniref:Minor coat protein n=1 Tax=Silvimonas terrae TaxID=300266 RepID=A0A840RCN0_9NEIS|nr:hypothetical protein [Silvimonas terrae]MBB5190717.1 hypothetical protein [Silvimonas terrae]